MNVSTKNIARVSLVLFASLALGACATAQGLRMGTATPGDVHFSYAEVPIDEQIQLADVIVAGTITDISGTRWNQDSGEYWEEVVKDDAGGETIHVALPYYTTTIAVDRLIVADADSARQVVLTTVGMSPQETTESAALSRPLQVGDQVVIFATRDDLAWRNGTRPILKTASLPEQSSFVRGDDGRYRTAQVDEMEREASLDDLLARIGKLRSANAQPQAAID